MKASIAGEDFTLRRYQSLLQVAQDRFRFVPYGEIPWESQFVLWRHDVDISLNRARRCAEEECRLGLIATYFINPTSSFYNLFETSQAQLVKRIEAMGHRIGLHFDANGVDPVNLDAEIGAQRSALEEILGVSVEAVSFHNPKAEHLTLDADTYAGGLVNAYSRTLMQAVTYTSDSNGYWRYRPLLEVLQDESVTRLQVLTHPGWWQDIEMPPRSRIWRSVYGRASNILRDYDELLRNDRRENRSGGLRAGLRGAHLPNDAVLDHQGVIDLLWNAEAFAPLYVFLKTTLAAMQENESSASPTGAGAHAGARQGEDTGALTSGVETIADVMRMTKVEVWAACLDLMECLEASQHPRHHDDAEVGTTPQTDS